jgi:hypothetical protein
MNRHQRRATSAANGSPMHCHAMVANLAKEMAGTWYDETAMHDDKFYRDWPKVDEFVGQNWGMFVKQARETLAQMLGLTYDERTKELIYEALTQDKLLH